MDPLFNIMLAIFLKVSLTVSSPAFNSNGSIPGRYTCDGKNINPALTITSLPFATKSIAIILDDPDAPGGTFTHWIVWNIPPDGIIAENSIPGVEGKNGADKTHYIGPCPPVGTHRYFFKVFALDVMLDLQKGATRQELETAMQNHILASGELLGLYRKKTAK